MVEMLFYLSRKSNDLQKYLCCAVLYIHLSSCSITDILDEKLKSASAAIQNSGRLGNYLSVHDLVTQPGFRSIVVSTSLEFGIVRPLSEVACMQDITVTAKSTTSPRTRDRQVLYMLFRSAQHP
jgi:hypothetical protein